MSKGGGSSQRQTTTQEPWKPAQPYLTDIMGQGQTLSRQAPSYFGGPLTVGATDAEGAAWGARNSYNSSVFGGAPNSPQFGDLTTALGNQMNGRTDLGNMSSSISPFATQNLTNGFRNTDTSGISGVQGPGTTNSAGQIGQYGFGTSLDAQGRAPTFGQAGGLDARGAYQSMLSGTPDYQGVQGAIESANAPLMRQFNEEVIPGLNQRATFTNNMTGGIKGLNRALPQLADRMSENALAITEGERQRALGAQERAAGAVSQGGMQGYGLGLQTAQGERGLEQGLASMGLSADSTRANQMMQDYGSRQAQSGFGLQQQGMLADIQGRDRADLLNLGSLGGQLAGQAGAQQQGAMGQFGNVYNMGRQQGTDALEYANYDRALREDSLGAQREQFDYMRDAPMNQLGWYSSLINGTASPYGSSATTGPTGSRAAGALGGAMAGGQMGSQMFNNNPWATGIGALLGGYAGGYG
jgi:hypothetical protein